MQIVISSTELQRIHSTLSSPSTIPPRETTVQTSSKSRQNVHRNNAETIDSKRTQDLLEKERFDEIKRCEQDAIEEKYQSQERNAIIERANFLVYVLISHNLFMRQISRKRQNAKFQFSDDAI